MLSLHSILGELPGTDRVSVYNYDNNCIMQFFSRTKLVLVDLHQSFDAGRESSNTHMSPPVSAASPSLPPTSWDDHSGTGGGSDDDHFDDDDDWNEVDEQLASRYESVVSLGPMGGSASLSQSAGASLRATERKAGQAKQIGITRDTRATCEQVLDPRTRLLLFKLINSGMLTSINGCVSTGKEANVYHAFGPDDTEFAVKVYKTSILVFKDRDRYVSGEFRFRHGYCKANPRKMVRMWAEKEMRNYRRLALAGVPCPSVHLLREHVLLMGFLGRDGYAAPRLKDASLTPSQYADASTQVMLLLRMIYQQCRLVHGDFSEYNLLWYKGTVYVIDVSQSVEHDHPNALTFLRKDCENAISFFRRNGIFALPTLQPLFDFVTDPRIPADGARAAYDRIVAAATAPPTTELPPPPPTSLPSLQPATSSSASAAAEAAAAARAEAEVSEAVFSQMHIPRTLEELSMKQMERDIAAAASGQGSTLAYTTLMGLNSDLSVGPADEGTGRGTVKLSTPRSREVQTVAKGSDGGGVGGGDGEGRTERVEGDEEEDSDEEGSEESGEEGSEESGEEGERRARRSERLHKFEDPEAKRERKAAVKAAQREARLTKTPKHVKKQKKKGPGKK